MQRGTPDNTSWFGTQSLRLKSARESLGKLLQEMLTTHANKLIWHNENSFIPSKAHAADPDDIKFLKHALLAVHNLELVLNRIIEYKSNSLVWKALSTPGLIGSLWGAYHDLSENYQALNELAPKFGGLFSETEITVDRLKASFYEFRQLDISTLSAGITSLVTNYFEIRPSLVSDAAINYEKTSTTIDSIFRERIEQSAQALANKIQELRRIPGLEKQISAGPTESGFYKVNQSDDEAISNIKYLYNLVRGIDQFFDAATNRKPLAMKASLEKIYDSMRISFIDYTTRFGEKRNVLMKSLLKDLDINFYLEQLNNITSRLIESEIAFHLKPGTLTGTTRPIFENLIQFCAAYDIDVSAAINLKNTESDLQLKLETNKNNEIEFKESIIPAIEFLSDLLNDDSILPFKTEEEKILSIKFLSDVPADLKKMGIPITTEEEESLMQFKDYMFSTLASSEGKDVIRKLGYVNENKSMRHLFIPGGLYNITQIQTLKALTEKMRSSIRKSDLESSEIKDQLSTLHVENQSRNIAAVLTLLQRNDLCQLLSAVKAAKNSEKQNITQKNTLATIFRYTYELNKGEPHLSSHSESLSSLSNPSNLIDLIVRCFEHSKNEADKTLCQQQALLLVQAGFFDDKAANHPSLANLLTYQPTSNLASTKVSNQLNAITKLEINVLLQNFYTPNPTINLVCYLLTIKKSDITQITIAEERTHLSLIRDQGDRFRYILHNLYKAYNESDDKNSCILHIMRLAAFDSEFAKELFTNPLYSNMLKHGLLINPSLHLEANLNRFSILTDASDLQSTIDRNYNLITAMSQYIDAKSGNTVNNEEYFELLDKFLKKCPKNGPAHQKISKFALALSEHSSDFKSKLFKQFIETADLDFLSSIDSDKTKAFWVSMKEEFYNTLIAKRQEIENAKMVLEQLENVKSIKSQSTQILLKELIALINNTTKKKLSKTPRKDYYDQTHSIISQCNHAIEATKRIIGSYYIEKILSICSSRFKSVDSTFNSKIKNLTTVIFENNKDLLDLPPEKMREHLESQIISLKLKMRDDELPNNISTADNAIKLAREVLQQSIKPIATLKTKNIGFFSKRSRKKSNPTPTIPTPKHN